MPFNIQYLARNSSSGNIDAGKLWVYNGTGVLGSNESLATISASGYFNAAQVTLDAIFAAGSTGTTGQLAVNDIIQINGNDATGVFVVTSVTGNVTVVAQSGGGGGGGTVYNIDTGQGLVGGPITTTGTIALDNIPTLNLLANITGTNAPPIPNDLSDIMDAVFGTTWGEVIFRGSSGWESLAPGTDGQFFMTHGPGIDPVWENAGVSFHNWNAFWIDDLNGNDSEVGTNDNQPFLTYNQGISLSTGAPTVMYGMNSNGNNGESIATLGTGQTIIINAPATSFQGSITQNVDDEISLEAFYVDSFVSNSASPTLLKGGEMFVTTTSTGTVTATVNQYYGAHTGGGSLNLNTPYLASLTTDNTITAFVVASEAQNINNGGSLDILCGTPPGVALASNTGSITGLMGNVIFGDLGVALSTATSPSYSLTSAAPTDANQVLLSSGAGPGATTVWAAAGGYTPFAYPSTIWRSTAGNDSSLGTSIETPLLTIQQTITNATTVPTLIQANDYDNVNSEAILTTGAGQKLVINAPSLDASFSACNFTIQPNDQVTLTAFNYYSITCVGDNSTFNIPTIETFNNEANNTVINSQFINSFNQGAGYSSISCLSTGATSVTGGLATFLCYGVNSSTITASNSSGVYLYSLAPPNAVLTTGASINLLSGSAATITNDGTCAVVGFAGSTIYGAANNDGQGAILSTINANCTFSALASAGKVLTITTSVPSAQYTISNIYLNFGGTNFAGGDRDLILTDGITIYTKILAATLLSLPNNENWGSASVPFPASAAISTPTGTGNNGVYWEYTGGTTDYTSGEVLMTVVYARVT